MSENSISYSLKTSSDEKARFQTDKDGIFRATNLAGEHFCLKAGEKKPTAGSDFRPVLLRIFGIKFEEIRFPSGISEAEMSLKTGGHELQIRETSDSFFFRIDENTADFAPECWKTAPEASAVLSSDFVPLHVNPAFEVLLGIKSSHRSLRQFFEEKNEEAWTNAGQKAAEGETVSFRLSRETPGGSIKFYAVNLCPFSQNRLLFTAREISSQVRREKTLIKDRERFDILLNNLPDMIFRIDEKGIFLDIGGGGINNLLAPDYTVGTVFPRTPIPDAAKPGLLEVVQNVLKTGRPQEYYYETQIGNKKLYLEARVSAIDQSESLVTVRDITETRRSQYELAESRARLESVFENTSDQIWAIDTEYRLLASNSSFSRDFEKMFGKKPEIGETITDFVGPKIRDYWKALYRKALLGEPFKKILVQRLSEDKNRRFSFAFNPIRNRENELIGVSVFGTDVTDLKEAEDALLKAKKKAEEAVRTKSYFLSVVTHELRTPVNAVAGITQLLMNEPAVKMYKDFLSTLKFSAENMSALINDILDFEKIENGKVEFEQNDFEIRPLLNNIRNSLLIKAVSKGIGFRMTVSPKVPGILSGDKYRLTQILTNLCSNAVKFTEKGHVELKVDLVRKNDKFFETKFTVQDTGIGIPAERIPYVFERFEQGGRDITRRFGGTGLGLNITKRLIEMQNGRIDLESTEGEGTTAGVILQFAKASGNRLPDTFYKGSEFLSLSGVRILSVEDNPVNQLVISSFIQKWSGKTEPVSNGKEALEMLKTKKFDLILTDLLMPEMDGFELSRAIRAQEDSYLKLIPILALTASSSPDIRKAVKEAGMNGLVGKPFKASELYDSLIRYVMDTPEFAGNEKNKNNYLPDLEQFKQISEGDKELFNSLLNQTIRQISDYARQLPEALRLGNEKVVRHIVHTAKPTLDLIGLGRLNEEFAHTQSLFDFSPEVEALAHEAGKTEKILQEIVRNLEKAQ